MRRPAGPALFRTLEVPTNRPVPITPEMARSWIWCDFNPRWVPYSESEIGEAEWPSLIDWHVGSISRCSRDVDVGIWGFGELYNTAVRLLHPYAFLSSRNLFSHFEYLLKRR
jgi:hypothetical protein